MLAFLCPHLSAHSLIFWNSVHPYNPPSKETLEVLVSQNTKLCPYCSIAVQKRSGCSGVVCAHCRRAFQFNQARDLKKVHREWYMVKFVEHLNRLHNGTERMWIGTQRG